MIFDANNRSCVDLTSEKSAGRLAGGGPRHLAVIMDGNGRWATARGRPRSFGHFHGMKCIGPIVEQASSVGISYLTLFAFSTENWLRSRREVGFLMRLFGRYLSGEAQKLKELGVRLRVIGQRDNLDADLVRLIEQAETLTAGGDRLQLLLAISYGGLDEIVYASRSIGQKIANQSISPAEITRTTIAQHLYAPEVPEVDFLIRTGNEMRLSNFLMWRLAYAELLFVKTLWPDFTPKTLRRCLQHFCARQRKFGAAE